jgi:hypothetical protein
LRMIMIEMPQHKVRYHDKAESGKIAPKLKFWRVYRKYLPWLTPSIQDVIQVKKVLTLDAKYRIIDKVKIAIYFCNLNIDWRARKWLI